MNEYSCPAIISKMETVDFDTCPRCGEYIDLSQPHAYDREEGRPVCLGCGG